AEKPIRFSILIFGAAPQLRGIGGGLFAVIVWARFAAVCIRTIRSSNGDGRPGLGPPAISITLRITCTGVKIKPHGNPHQPSAPENKMAPSCRRVAQPLHESSGLELHDVTSNADQTRC